MKALSSAALLVCVAIVFAACGGGNNSSNAGGGGGGETRAADLSTPKGCLEALDAAYKAKDIKALVACYDVPADKAAEMEAEAGKEFKELWDAGGSIRLTWKDEDLKVEGDNAEIACKLMIKEKADAEEKPDGERVKMRKVDGKWKCYR